ncbi:MAG TPA: hypothetical protein VG408_05215 [Actinomycetota bacterium]|nr:hypothetical protein [Actinomycetota bacterium]
MRNQAPEVTQTLERAAEALPGIRRVRADMTGGRLKVRALVAPEKTDQEAIGMLRDLAAHRLGIRLTEDEIEILRTGEAPAREDGARRRLMSLTTERLEDRFIVRVVLEMAGDLLMGDSGSVAKKPQEEQRIVAEAVINALSEVLDHPPTLDSVESIYDEGVGLALVALESDAGTMIGTARLRQNEHDAVARATLDAINRATDLKRGSSAGARKDQ